MTMMTSACVCILNLKVWIFFMWPILLYILYLFKIMLSFFLLVCQKKKFFFFSLKWFYKDTTHHCRCRSSRKTQSTLLYPVSVKIKLNGCEKICCSAGKMLGRAQIFNETVRGKRLLVCIHIIILFSQYSS